MAKVKYEESLSACYPEIAAEWHPTMNLPLMPEDVHNGSSTYVYWLCPQGHTYRKTVGKRTKRGQGCPQCRLEKGSFSAKHPELLQYWDFEKNGENTPQNTTAGSEYKAWWVCGKGHSYQQKVNAKSNGAGCPICSSQILTVDNCLATTDPWLAAEWNSEKNGELSPYDVMRQSHTKVWWKCPRGHEWPAVVYSRLHKGCPICDSEKRTSFPEQAISFYLNKLFAVDSRFNVGGFEADVYCPDLKVAIEYDGEYYHKGNDNDLREKRKNQFFIDEGILLFRVKETKKKIDFRCCATEYGYEVSATYSQDYYFIENVVTEILSHINERFQKNYAIDIDIDRDKVEILNLYAQQKDENSFLSQKPLGAQKWDYEKNGDINLSLLPRMSKKKYWWKCPTCGNEWYGSLDNIVNSLTCNKCVRQVKPEIDMAPEIYMDSSAVFRVLPNSLQTENPELASQWHPTKNGFFKPCHVKSKSGKRVWWLCPECGNEWPQYIKTRNNGKTARKCPRCANNQKKENVGEMDTFLDILFEEWHSTKNGEQKLTDYTPGSTVKVWWRCSKCGNEFQCSPKHRRKGGGCTVCGRISSNEAKYKKIRNVDTGEVFEAVKIAAEHYGIHRTSITNCLRGKSKTGGGFSWEYVND